MYLVIDDAIGLVEKNDGKKYLTFNLMKNNELYDSIWNKLKELWNVNKNEFDKDYYVVAFESDDKINGNIIINTMAVIIKSVFKDDALYCPQLGLNYCYYGEL